MRLRFLWVPTTDARSGFGSMDTVNWCSRIIHETLLVVHSLGFWLNEGHGVYRSGLISNNHANRYGFSTYDWIVQVNDKAMLDMQNFLNVTNEFEH